MNLKKNKKYRCIFSLLADSPLGSYRKLFVESLMRIPTQVLEKVSTHCLLDRFVILYENNEGIALDIHWTCMATHGVKTSKLSINGVEEKFKTIAPITFTNYIIVINESAMKKLTREEQMSIIAHEFAHVFLEHKVYGRNANFTVEDELKTDELIEKWGFKSVRE